MENLVDINDLREGNHKAFEQLFKEWYLPLSHYAYSIIQDLEEAEDVVQKMFCKLWDQREKLEIHTSMKSYLYRIIHNDCLNKIKSQKVREEHQRYLSYANPDRVEGAENIVLEKDLEKNILTALDKLPPRCKEVFLLSRYENLSYAEIAASLSISSNTVETQIVKALKILRKELKEYIAMLIAIISSFS